MLKIRLQRVGRKHEPVFRFVLTNSQNGPKSGKFLEILGSYDARRGDRAEISEANGEKIKTLISKGAQVSDTVRNVLISKKIIDGKKSNVLPKGVVARAKSKIEENKKAAEQAKIDAKAAAEEAAKAPVEEKVEDKTEEIAEEAPAVAEKIEEIAPEPTEETPTEVAPESTEETV